MQVALEGELVCVAGDLGGLLAGRLECRAVGEEVGNCGVDEALEAGFPEVGAVGLCSCCKYIFGESFEQACILI